MTKKLNIDIIARDKSKQALNQVQGNLQQTKSSVINLKNALIGLGVGAVIKSFVDVGKEVENLQVRFKFLFGSAEEGALAFDNLSKFASQVPFSLDEITQASGNLAVVAKDANDLNRILEITGNVAAVTGLDFATAGSQIQRAFSGGIGAADVFREKGVRSLLGFKEGAKVSIDETVAAFEKAFSGDGEFAKATEELANTLTGTTSMLQDKLFNFKKIVSDQFVGTLTDELGDLNQYLEDNRDTINEIATLLGKTLANSIILLGKSLTTTKSTMDKFNIGVRDLLLDVVPLGFGLGTIREEFPELANAIDGYLDSQYPANDAIKDFNKSIEDSSTAMGNASEALANMTKVLDEHEEAYKSKVDVAKIVADAELQIQQEAHEEMLKEFKRFDGEMRRRDIANTNFSKNEAEKKAEIERMAQGQIVDAVGDGLSKVSGLNKDAFRAYQAFQIGMATLNTFRAASNALSTYPFPLNIGVAAAETARGLATVAQIRATAPPRISGGRVNAGEPYMVGEGGREMFVPQSSGTIVPNNQLSSPNVNITINANDTEGFDELLVKRRSVIVNVINDALNSQGKEALV